MNIVLYTLAYLFVGFVSTFTILPLLNRIYLKHYMKFNKNCRSILYGIDFVSFVVSSLIFFVYIPVCLVQTIYEISRLYGYDYSFEKLWNKLSNFD